MYLSLLQIKNFRCFDGNEHSITFKKGLNVLVGENDSGKSAIMDAIKLVLGTTDMNWYRVEQEDFYKEDATLEIKITCKFEELNEDERGAFLECLSYEDENKIEDAKEENSYSLRTMIQNGWFYQGNKKCFCDNDELTLNEIAHNTKLSATTVLRIINSLQKRGYVNRNLENKKRSIPKWNTPLRFFDYISFKK